MSLNIFGPIWIQVNLDQLNFFGLNSPESEFSQFLPCTPLTPVVGPLMKWPPTHSARWATPRICRWLTSRQWESLDSSWGPDSRQMTPQCGTASILLAGTGVLLLLNSMPWPEEEFISLDLTSPQPFPGSIWNLRANIGAATDVYVTHASTVLSCKASPWADTSAPLPKILSPPIFPLAATGLLSNKDSWISTLASNVFIITVCVCLLKFPIPSWETAGEDRLEACFKATNLSKITLVFRKKQGRWRPFWRGLGCKLLTFYAPLSFIRSQNPTPATS